MSKLNNNNNVQPKKTGFMSLNKTELLKSNVKSKASSFKDKVTSSKAYPVFLLGNIISKNISDDSKVRADLDKVFSQILKKVDIETAKADEIKKEFSNIISTGARVSTSNFQGKTVKEVSTIIKKVSGEVKNKLLKDLDSNIEKAFPAYRALNSVQRQVIIKSLLGAEFNDQEVQAWKTSGDNLESIADSIDNAKSLKAALVKPIIDSYKQVDKIDLNLHKLRGTNPSSKNVKITATMLGVTLLCILAFAGVMVAGNIGKIANLSPLKDGGKIAQAIAKFCGLCQKIAGKKALIAGSVVLPIALTYSSAALHCARGEFKMDNLPQLEKLGEQLSEIKGKF